MAENSTRSISPAASGKATNHHHNADTDQSAIRPSLLSIAVIRQFARAYRVEPAMPPIFAGLLLN
ncbi:MAG: hypothetical protein NC187_05540 [Candidatus Amulumruptor caecigallinarius]|nr:hypothetical protein [Candidatus Amulumruptor caecigallinarius]MCM1396932.1 hypothetical protein [Candidatus Amulumruptor caecigallinarius]MCM1454124.1 hypothetical protein [bacterium]